MKQSGDYGEGGAASPPTLVIVAATEGGRRTGMIAAGMAGLPTPETIAPDAAATLATRIFDIAMIDIRGLDDTAAEGLLAGADAAARAAPLALVVAISDDQIDLATALLFGPHVRHLCDPSIAELAAGLAGAAQRGRRDRAGESSRDDDRLKRLNDEVARIAEALARLSREEEGASGEPGRVASGGGVRDVARGYGAPPAATGGGVRAIEVRQAIRARRLRTNFFDAELFADPAWDMLLDLFAAEIEGALVSVSSLCIAAAVPGTTALRWIASMTEGGLFDRQPDPADRRRAHVILTDRSRAAMRGYFASVKASGVVLV